MRKTARRQWSLTADHMVAYRIQLRLFLIPLVLLLCGCQGRTVRTTPQPPEQTGTAEMELLGPPERRDPTPADLDLTRPMDIQAIPRRQGKPDYPPQALPTGQACAARILYHVEVDGSATLVRLEWDKAPDTSYLKLFEDSIRDAMAGWEFSPAHRLMIHEDQNGVLGSKAIPIKYADRVIIRFSVLDGKGIVE